MPLNGTAVFTYGGEAAGTDTITAEVLFAGEGTGLLVEATANWELPVFEPGDPDDPTDPDDPGELPRTGGYPYLGFGLLVLLGGTLAVKKRK